jgi:hypothetical protein
MDIGKQIIIANQMSAEFGELLRQHPSGPTVIDCLDTERPWIIPDEADVLVTMPYPAWAGREAAAAEMPLPCLK